LHKKINKFINYFFPFCMALDKHRKVSRSNFVTSIRFCAVVRVPLEVAPSLGMKNTLASRNKYGTGSPDNFPIKIGTGRDKWWEQEECEWGD
jgi:hypothetical protein